MTAAGLQRAGNIDQTLANYLRAIISVLLNVALIVAVLDIFGVKTTSFAALLAGAGLAIGTAWGGLFIDRLKIAMAGFANVVSHPAPEIDIFRFTPEGPLLCIGPCTHTEHYSQVFFDTHKAVVSTFNDAGYPLPDTRVSSRKREET